MRAAVLGSPIAHSKSPALHRAAYAAAGLDWQYDPIEVTSEELPAFLAGLGPEWAGLSLTMPLKTAAIALLPELSATAAATSSVNTVVFPSAPGAAGSSAAAQGLAVGHNTDVDGIVAAVLAASPSATATTVATVLGAGATARSAVVAAAELGAGVVEVYARRSSAADDLASWAAGIGIQVRPGPWSRVADGLRRSLVISTVPSGAADALAASVGSSGGGDLRSFDGQSHHTLLDVVYDPWPTPLAMAWQAAGGVVVPGLAMLLHQAAVQVELMTGVAADLTAMRNAVGL